MARWAHGFLFLNILPCHTKKGALVLFFCYKKKDQFYLLSLARPELNVFPTVKPCCGLILHNMIYRSSHHKIAYLCIPTDRWFPSSKQGYTVYPKKYAHGFVVLCFVVVMQSFIMNSHEVFIHIHQGCFAGTGAIVRLPQCQWSKPGGYGKISQCITTTKHSKAKTVCIFLGIYCSLGPIVDMRSANKRRCYKPSISPQNSPDKAIDHWICYCKAMKMLFIRYIITAIYVQAVAKQDRLQWKEK